MILESCVSEMTLRVDTAFQKYVYMCTFVSYSKAVDFSSLSFSLFCTRLLGLFMFCFLFFLIAKV